MHRYLLLAVLLCAPVLALGEDSNSDPKSGRLADGRAYRTDPSGTQLVDYIAELELSVESLKRRVNGLEDEVSEKQKVIERVNKGEQARGELEERDLTVNTGAASAKQSPKDLELNKIRTQSQSEILILKNRIAELEQQLDSQRRTLHSSSDTNARTLGDKEAQLAALRQEFANLKTDFDVDKQIHEKEAGELTSQIALLKEELDSRNETIETVQEQLETANQEIKRVSDERDNLFKVANKNRAPEIVYQEASHGHEDSRASFSSAKIRALESLKSTLFTELNQLGSLQSSRDSLMRSYAAGNHAVMFRPTLAISSRGLKADQIRKQVQQAESVRDLSLLKGEINEVKLKLQDDVALLKRLAGSSAR